MFISNKSLKYFLFIWLALIWIVSSVPGDSLPQLETFNLDTLAHVFVYLVLGILLFVNHSKGLFSRYSRQQILMIAIILAALDEAHQVFIPFRQVSVLDLAANIGGLTAAYFIIRLMQKHYD